MPSLFVSILTRQGAWGLTGSRRTFTIATACLWRPPFITLWPAERRLPTAACVDGVTTCCGRPKCPRCWWNVAFSPTRQKPRMRRRLHIVKSLRQKSPPESRSAMMWRGERPLPEWRRAKAFPSNRTLIKPGWRKRAGIATNAPTEKAPERRKAPSRRIQKRALTQSDGRVEVELPVLTTAQMRAAEQAAFARGAAVESLMDKAGAGVARLVSKFFPRAGKCIVFAGKGHNAGHALFAPDGVENRGVSRLRGEAVEPADAQKAGGFMRRNSRKRRRKTRVRGSK